MQIFYEFISFTLGILQTFSQSVFNYPILYAFSLGMIGAFAPCQITSNLSLLTLYTSEGIQGRFPFKSLLSFTLGKLIVYCLLGLFVFILGREFQQNLTLLFPFFSKIIGPLWIFSGIWLLFSRFLQSPFSKLQNVIAPHDSNASAFLYGVFLTLGFCPTMFSLFFLSLVPISLNNTLGFLLPIPFTVGTIFPLLFLLLLLHSLPLEKGIIKKSRKLGSYLQKLTGIILIALGIYQLTIMS